MNRFFNITAAVSAMVFVGNTAIAAECPVSTLDPFELGAADIDSIYDCMKDSMAAGYAKKGDEVGSNFRDWTITGTRPGVAGAHGERLLLTFANDIAAAQYLKFAEEGVVMPAGSILAKESIKISKKKKTARIGPLFTMTKVEAGGAPETNDWVYGGILPNGKPMKIKQSFCHDCHTSWEDQDYLAYPLEEVRVSN